MELLHVQDGSHSLSTIMSYSNILASLNSVITVLIVIVRHDDIKKSLISLVCRATVVTPNDRLMQVVPQVQRQVLQ